MAGNRARIVVRIAVGVGALWLLIYGVVHWRDLRRIEADAAPFLAAFGLHEIEADGWEESGYLLRAVGTPEDVMAAVFACESEASVERKEAASLQYGVSLPPQLRGPQGGLFLVSCMTGGCETQWGTILLHCNDGRLSAIGVSRSSTIVGPLPGWSELSLPVSVAELARRLQAGELAAPRTIAINLDADGPVEFLMDVGHGVESGAVVEGLRGMIVDGKLERFVSDK